MKNINLTGCGMLFCAALSLSGCFFHRPAFYPAQVLMRDGMACFSVTNNREARASPPELSYISVYSVDDEKANPVWHQMFPSNRPIMSLSQHKCLIYGEGSGDVPVLRQGFHYRVITSAYINGNHRRYHAYFCLYETSKGEVKIHYAKWNNKIGGRDWQVCEK